MFMTTFGENHVWKQAGERETENEFWDIFEVKGKFFDGPRAAKEASLDPTVSVSDVITDGS